MLGKVWFGSFTIEYSFYSLGVILIHPTDQSESADDPVQIQAFGCDQCTHYAV
jgi:hypothetical protein